LKHSALLAAALVLGFAPAADADTRAKLFPLSSSGLPKSLAGAPAELTRVLARSLGAETTTVPIEDAADLIECSLTQNSCLEAIATSVGVTRILFGRIERRDGSVIVKLTSYEAGKGETAREITISGETADELATSLEDTLTLVKKEPVEDPPIVVTDPPPPLESTGGVTSGTWAMVIGGGAAVGVGVGLVLSANSLRTQVERAPTETREDIAFLLGLEKAGQQRMKIGGALMVVGGVVGTIGVIRMIAQNKSPNREEPRFDVVPESGGASVWFSMGWR
jgi:hypothetical protein